MSERMNNNSAWVQNIFMDELRHDRLLGSGSYGIVSLGYHKQFGKVAYKQFKQHGINQTLDQREIDTLLMFNGHPNIVRIYGMLSERSTSKFHFGFVMELMDYSLSTVMHNKQHTYNMNHVVNWFRGVAAGLAVLHAHNVIHRDIRPDNVLTDRSFEQTRLCDFGLSTELRLEMTAGRGCDGYMAPELFNVTELCQYTSSCDMYSFGVLMKEVLSKRQVNTIQCEESIMDRLNNMITSCCNVDANTRPTSHDTLHILVAIQEEISSSKMTDSGVVGVSGEVEKMAMLKVDKVGAIIKGYKKSVYGSKEEKSKESILQQLKQGEETQPSVPMIEYTHTCDKCERNKNQLHEEIRKREEAERKLQLAEQKARSAIEEVGRVELERRETYRQLQEVERLRKVAEEEIALARDEALCFKLQLEEERRKLQDAEEQARIAREEFESVQFEREEKNRNRPNANYRTSENQEQADSAEDEFQEKERQRKEEEQHARDSQKRRDIINAKSKEWGRQIQKNGEMDMINLYDTLLSGYGPYSEQYSSSSAGSGSSRGPTQRSNASPAPEMQDEAKRAEDKARERMHKRRKDGHSEGLDSWSKGLKTSFENMVMSSISDGAGMFSHMMDAEQNAFIGLPPYANSASNYRPKPRQRNDRDTKERMRQEHEED